MPDPTSRGRRKAPKNTEWRGNILFGRKKINGKLRRWTLRTGDVDIARKRVAEDIERLSTAAFYGDSRVSYRDLVASWFERHIVHEVGPRTVLRYNVSLRQLEPFLLELFVDEIDRDQVKRIVDARRAAGVATATIRRDLTALASVLDFAEVEDNPALARLKQLKERRDPIVLPEPAHIERIIARAPGRMAALLQTAWRTGCRREELVTAARTRLDPRRRPLPVGGKGRQLRVIDLDNAAYETLRALPVRLGCRWLFWHGQGEPYRNLSSRFAAIVAAEARAAGERAIEAGHDEPDFRKFRFHDLRHAFAVDWLKAGKPIYDLQQQLGHASIKTTEIYLKFLTAEEARAVKFGARAPDVAERRGM